MSNKGTRTHNLALVTLQLNDFTHFTVHHDSAIASKLFLDDGENLLSVELIGQSLNSGQGLATVALYVDQLRHAKRTMELPRWGH